MVWCSPPGVPDGGCYCWRCIWSGGGSSKGALSFGVHPALVPLCPCLVSFSSAFYPALGPVSFDYRYGEAVGDYMVKGHDYSYPLHCNQCTYGGANSNRGELTCYLANLIQSAQGWLAISSCTMSTIIGIQTLTNIEK